MAKKSPEIDGEQRNGRAKNAGEYKSIRDQEGLFPSKQIFRLLPLINMTVLLQCFSDNANLLESSYGTFIIYCKVVYIWIFVIYI